jgi:hypothetical protein
MFCVFSHRIFLVVKMKQSSLIENSKLVFYGGPKIDLRPAASRLSIDRRWQACEAAVVLKCQHEYSRN